MKKYLIIIVLLLSITIGNAQYIDTVCVGTIHTYGVYGSVGSTYNWTVNGGNIISSPTNIDSVKIKWGSAGIYPLSVTETNINNCDSTVSGNVLVLPIPVVNLGNDTTICNGLSMTLNVTTPNATYLWNNGSTNPIYIVTNPDTYWVKVSIDNLCSSSDTVKVDEIYAPPDFYLFNDTTLCLGIPINITIPNDNYYNILWYDGNNSEFSHLINQTGNYFVELLNQCDTIKKDFSITYKDCGCYIYFPNAFTPNGDGINDYFKPVLQCELTTYELYIYDRWGELVFETKSNGVYWDGKYKNGYVPTGVYEWLFYYKGLYTRDMQYKKGSVTVVR